MYLSSEPLQKDMKVFLKMFVQICFYPLVSKYGCVVCELRSPTSSKLGKLRNIGAKEGRLECRALGDSCFYFFELRISFRQDSSLWFQFSILVVSFWSFCREYLDIWISRHDERLFFYIGYPRSFRSALTSFAVTSCRIPLVTTFSNFL